MALGSAKRGETQVVVPHRLAALQVVGVGLRFQAVCKALVGFVGPHEVQKAFVLVAKDPAQTVPEVAVGSDFRLVVDGAVGRLVSPSQDVDGASHRGNGQLAGAQTALHLRGANHQVQPSPVAPVHPAVFHVVHGHAVHHDRKVGLVEAANGHSRISVATSLLGGVHPRGGVQHQGKVTACEFLLNLRRKDIRESHGRLAGDDHICRDHGLFHDEGLHAEADRRVRALALDLTGLAFVADVGHLDRSLPFGHGQRKHPVEIRGDHRVA